MTACEVSVVLPCLNEAETLATCVGKATASLDALSIAGEVVVADNGSTDGSQAIAAPPISTRCWTPQGTSGTLLQRAVPMAGARAAEAVASGISALADRHPDVIEVARGGGAPGEMAWADTATVARAITRCPVPVWTAIGHATNRTVGDLVANRACTTPSAAASALIAMVDQDTYRRHAETAAAAQASALAHAAARARVAWLTVAMVLIVLVAVLIAGLGR